MQTGYQKMVSIVDLGVGEIKRVDINGRGYLLANVEGEFFVADDLCTHEDVSLALGCLKGEWIKCSLHGSQFNLRTGEVMEEPADEPLRVYPVKIEDGDVFAKLD